MKKENNFAGLNGFIWWVGIVENRVDPLGLGRCQVRIFGWYGPEIKTIDLPWAHPMYPINNSKSFSAPLFGDWVMGFFMDGESGQFPIMMGVLPGIYQAPDSITSDNQQDNPDNEDTDINENTYIDPTVYEGQDPENFIYEDYTPTDSPEGGSANGDTGGYA
jgi:hypothetical protein